jgi:Xaa-Pro aminopeptidase
MREKLQKHVIEFQRRIADENIDMAFIEDADNIYYLSGYWGYLAMDFGRPTILIVPQSGSPTIITPGLEAEMARAMTWIEDIREWTDGVGGGWVAHLQDLLGGLKSKRIGILRNKTHPMILECLQREFPGAVLIDISDTLGEMRMVKSHEEIAVLLQAGQVAVAMCEAGVKAIAEGVPEYEVALVVIAGGTRKAAEFLSEEGADRLFSPLIYNLQILQSGGPPDPAWRPCVYVLLRNCEFQTV